MRRSRAWTPRLWTNGRERGRKIKGQSGKGRREAQRAKSGAANLPQARDVSCFAKRAKLVSRLTNVPQRKRLNVFAMLDVVRIEEQLRKKGAALHIMDPAMDTSTPAGRLTFNVLASIAQFEREIMLTRQREGIAKARGEGKYKGRAPTARSRADRIRELSKAGLSAKAIAEELSREKDAKGKLIGAVSERSVYRVLASSKPVTLACAA